MESPVIILRNDALILNGKENKEAGAICFEFRVSRKKNKKIFWKVPSKIYGSYFIMEKTKTVLGLSKIPNIITEKWGLEYRIENDQNYLCDTIACLAY